MAHRAIVGQTGSGKTFAAQRMALAYATRGIGVLVLHKPREAWKLVGKSWETDDPDAFLRMFWAARSCACFMELADADVSKFDERFHKCFSQGRHEGHRCFYITQRAGQVHPNIRENCESLCLFAVGMKAAKLWTEEFNDDLLLFTSTLQPHEFFFKANRYVPAKRMKLSA